MKFQLARISYRIFPTATRNKYFNTVSFRQSFGNKSKPRGKFKCVDAKHTKRAEIKGKTFPFDKLSNYSNLISL